MAAAFGMLGLAELVRNGLLVGLLSNAIDQKLGLPVALAATAWAVHLGADTVMRGPAGLMIARYGPRWPMLLGAAVCLLAVLLFPLTAHRAWLLLLVAALQGVGFSAMWPGVMNLTADSAREGYQARALTFVGAAAMPFVGAGVLLFAALNARPAAYAFALAAALQALALVLVPFVPRRRPTAAAVDGPPPRLGAAALRPLLPLLPAAFMQTLTMTLIGFWIFRLAPHFGLSYGMTVGLLGFCAVLGYGLMPFTGRLADGGRGRLCVMVGYALLSLGLAGFLLTPPLWALFAFGTVAGVGYAFLTPGWAALVTQTLPEAERPGAWGLLMTAENIGVALGPVVSGLMLSAMGPTGPFAAGAGLALATSLLYVFTRFGRAPAPKATGA